MPTDKQRCSDLINEAGLVRLMVTNLRSMVEQGAGVLGDNAAMMERLIEAEKVMTGICRSQMVEVDGAFTLKDIGTPVLVYPTYKNPKPTPPHIEKLLVGEE